MEKWEEGLGDGEGTPDVCVVKAFGVGDGEVEEWAGDVFSIVSITSTFGFMLISVFIFIFSSRRQRRRRRRGGVDEKREMMIRQFGH